MFDGIASETLRFLAHGFRFAFRLRDVLQITLFEYNVCFRVSKSLLFRRDRVESKSGGFVEFYDLQIPVCLSIQERGQAIKGNLPPPHFLDANRARDDRDYDHQSSHRESKTKTWQVIILHMNTQ